MRTASAPASAANLGPGFDVLALALARRCRVTSAPSDEWQITSGGEAVSESTAAMVRAVVGDVGPHDVQIESDIPIGKGLGSSAALLVAGAASVGGTLDHRALFETATKVEGHPDNVGAAVFGGLIAVGADGAVNRLSIHPSLHVMVAVPNEESFTTAARAVLTAEVSRQVAVRTAARVAMLVEGLRTGDSGALASAQGDEIHEEPRRALTDTPDRLITAALAAGASYAAWSGAGPSVIVLAVEQNLDAVADSLQAALGEGGTVLELEIDRAGVRFE